MCMQLAAWPEPEPQIAAAIAAKYSGKRPRPLTVQVRDGLGQWLEDEQFAAAFGDRGRPGWSPSRLALVTVLQREENLADRAAAEAVRTRIDWQYLLGLPLDDPGFDHTVWSEFRDKVADAGLEQVALDALLGRLAAEGLVKAGGKQRTDSTHVVAAVAALSRLELAGESVRAALEALTAAHPDWVAQRICVPGFARRYAIPMISWRPPVSKARQDELAIAYARDGYALLEAVYGGSSPGWLREIPAVDVLRRVLVQNCTRIITADGREVIRRREKEPEGDGLPPGHIRIASPYDTDARWGAKREEFWLGYKLHVSGTCDDAPPCNCARAFAAARPAAEGAVAGRPGSHDRTCAHLVFPNLITHVATTDATVTGNQMTSAIDDELAGKNLAPGRHYLDSGYLSAALVVSERARRGIALIGPLLADTSSRIQEEDGPDGACAIRRPEGVFTDLHPVPGQLALGAVAGHVGGDQDGGHAGVCRGPAGVHRDDPGSRVVTEAQRHVQHARHGRVVDVRLVPECQLPALIAARPGAHPAAAVAVREWNALPGRGGEQHPVDDLDIPRAGTGSRPVPR
jgi:transposase